MTRTKRGRIVSGSAVWLLLLVGMFASCDSAEVPPPLDARAPTVEALTLAPAEASVDTLAVVEEGVRVPLELELTARPGDAPVQRVAYAIQWQYSCQPSAVEAAGEMGQISDDRYGVSTELVLPPGRRGAFRVNTWAIDASGRLSNEAATTFHLGGTNLGPPVIAQVDAPTQVQPPATLRLVVHVDDPDGLDHIARAEVDVPGSGTIPLGHTDTAGNNRPCDGIFSASFSVPAGAEPGVVRFTFRAFDRDGAVSEPVDLSVEIL